MSIYLIIFFFYTWSFIVEISLSIISIVSPVVSKSVPPTTSNKNSWAKPPSKPGKQTTSNTVSLWISHVRNGSGGSIYIN